MTLYYFVSPDGDYIETEDNVKDFYEKKFNPDMFTVRAKAEAEAVRRMKLRIKELKCLIKELMTEQLRLASYIKPISEADLHLVADGIERLQTQLTETRDLAEHWMILAEQRRVELGKCRKDAERLDWLIASGARVLQEDDGFYLFWHTSYRETQRQVSPRAAIDAAMEAKP